MQSKIKLSVAMIVYNVTDKIEQTLVAVKTIADEIIVVDSDSTDGTDEICRKFGATIYIKSWAGFVEQKNFAMSKCTGEYILSLDADEVLTDELKKNIYDTINSQNDTDGYYLKRKTVYLGKLLNYSWQPDKRLRLVKQTASPIFTGGRVHEELIVKSDKTATINGDLLHYSYRDLNDHNLKTISYAKLSAEDYFERGRRASMMKLIFSPIINFTKMYLFRLGFLDGVEGLLAATSGYTYTFYKYAYLYELTKKEKAGK